MADSPGNGGWRPVDDADGPCKMGAGNHQGLDGKWEQALLEIDCDRDACRSESALRLRSRASGNWPEPRVFPWRIQRGLPRISRDVTGSPERPRLRGLPITGRL